MEITFVLNRMSMRKRERLFKKAQKFVDERCIEYMMPYVPVAKSSIKGAGKLRNSVGISEPGHIVFTAPKAKVSYYAKVNHKHGGNPRATRLFFRTMKAESAETILRGAAKILGGKPK